MPSTPDRPITAIEVTVLFTAFIAATYGFGIYLFSMLVPDMRQSLGFDYGVVGVITGTAQVGFLLFALASGLLAPVLGPKRVILFSVLICAVSLLALSVAPTTLVAGLLLTVLGACAASVWVPMVAVSQALIPPQHQGKALGFMSSGTAYGVFLNGLLVPWLVPQYGWRALWLVVGLVTSVLFVWAVLRLGTRENAASPAAAATPSSTGINTKQWRLLKQPTALALMAVMFLSALACAPMQNYLAPFLREELNLSIEVATRSWSVIGLVGMFSGIVIGALADRITIRWAMVLTYLILSLSALAIWQHGSVNLIYAGAAGFGLAFYAIYGLVPAYISVAFRGAGATTLSGVTNVLAGVGGVIGNLSGGMTKQLFGSFSTVYFVILCAALTALLLSLLMRGESASSPIGDEAQSLPTMAS
ncbi:MAG: MFS transporter [Gammaproteobacteria bacterium]|nr:MFS transporter [Gammaproteobacteria bacterium]